MAIVFKSAVIHNGELFEIGESQAYSAELEARLVEEGVAFYEDGAQVAPKVEELEPEAVDIPHYSEDMKMDELKEIMKAEGLKYTVGMSKEDICKALDKHFGIETEAADDEDEELDLGAEDPVV